MDIKWLALTLLLSPIPASWAAQPGSVDDTFNPGSGADDIVKQAVVLSSGKILLGGYFNSINGIVRHGIAQLNSDGSVDSAFDPGAGVNNGISAIAVQGDGKILIGGEFTSVDGVTRNRIARLNTNGKLDTGFDPGTGFSGTSVPVVLTIAVQSDGRILVGGSFTNVNNVLRNHLARLESNGSVDSSFDAKFEETNGKGLFTVRQLANGQIIAGGVFTKINGQVRSALARLNSDGALDTAFNANFDGFSVVYSTASQNNQNLLVGGYFFSLVTTQLVSVASLNGDGSFDASFKRENSPDRQVNSLVIQSDGKILLAGYFGMISGVSRAAVARLLSDGTLDTGFDPGTGATGGPGLLTLAPQADGNIVIAGDFTQVNGSARNRIARLIGGSSSTVTPVAITGQPIAQNVCPEQPVTFSVTATGTGPLTYQWRKDGTPLPQATLDSYSIASASDADVGSYDVVVTGASGNITSNPASLGLNPRTAITLQPLSQNVCPGQAAVFGVTTSGTGISFQWKKDNTPIPSATNSTYSISSVASSDAAVYSVDVSGACGSLTSASAELILNTPTAINTQPAGKTVSSGDSVTFVVDASGSGNLSYVWRKDGTPISGVFSNIFTLAAVNLADAGNYDVVVTGACGSATSSPARLDVSVSQPLQLQIVGHALAGGFSFNLLGNTGTAYSVQFSTNLLNWIEWTNVIAGNPVVLLTDGSTNSPQRFYRAIGH